MECDLTIAYYAKRIKQFRTVIDEFCSEKGISSSMTNALTYRAHMGIGEFWARLYTAPKMYLANSRTYLNYRETLDPDFRDEILSTEEIFKLQQDVILNHALYSVLQELMYGDLIEYNKVRRA